MSGSLPHGGEARSRAPNGTCARIQKPLSPTHCHRIRTIDLEILRRNDLGWPAAHRLSRQAAAVVGTT